MPRPGNLREVAEKIESVTGLGADGRLAVEVVSQSEKSRENRNKADIATDGFRLYGDSPRRAVQSPKRPRSQSFPGKSQ